jgi:hypothetical protein
MNDEWGSEVRWSGEFGVRSEKAETDTMKDGMERFSYYDVSGYGGGRKV